MYDLVHNSIDVTLLNKNICFISYLLNELKHNKNEIKTTLD